jgi:hypothetical protein
MNLSERDALIELRAAKWEVSHGRDPRDICRDLGLPQKYASCFGAVRNQNPAAKRSSLAPSGV